MSALEVTRVLRKLEVVGAGMCFPQQVLVLKSCCANFLALWFVLPGALMPSQALEADEDLQLWKEIDDACSAYLSRDSQPQASSALEELCFLVMGFLQKPQVTHTKDYLFLFHYSKTHDSGNSDIVSSVLHPLLQLVPQLNERRLKRYKVDVCNLKLCIYIFYGGWFFFPV
uniref:Neuromedin U n=1 Tax=Aquila chrysaetos chrysaetos TaxID=223781 RepID=A0A663EGE5_AQUCH